MSPERQKIDMKDSVPVRRSSPLLIAAAWLVVLVPTGWGLSYTVRNALKLFAPPHTPAAGRPVK